MDNAKRGVAALEARDYSTAISEFTQALKSSPTAPDYYIKRSTAYQRSNPPNNEAALADAEQGVLCAQKRARRELIVQAQLRRAIALFGFGRYADAKYVWGVVKRMDPKEKTLAIWEVKINTKLAALKPGDEALTVTVQETPNVPAATVDSAEGSKRHESPDAKVNGANGTHSASAPSAQAQTPSNKIRHDWYQNSENVVVTLLVKGAPKEKAVIDIKDQSLSISFPLVSGSQYEFSLDPLFAAVDPAASRHSILSTKIEVTLKKLQPGLKWHALESPEPITEGRDNAVPKAIPSHILNASSAPSYPTSSRNGSKNWDKLADELTTKKSKPDGADGKAPGSADDDDDWDYEKEGGDEVNAFFKKLYSGASEDARKAMVKSFTESGGTALSTNWDEVKKETIKVQPPDGMEAKTWPS